MQILLDASICIANPALMRRGLALLSEDVRFLRGAYPAFDSWLSEKVIPGLLSGERTLLIETREERVAAVMILKHCADEKKLCTLRVHPEFESRGLGVRLFETAFDLLNTERPLLSVSEPSMPKFSRLFAHFGFSKEAVYADRYLPHVDEFSYNGYLEPISAARRSSVRKSAEFPREARQPQIA
jgi:ribosomal protein S18 acetylase RimI-like enzyme